MMVGSGTPHRGMRENLWWVLALVAFTAALLFGPGSWLAGQPGGGGTQRPGPTDPRSWRLTGPLAQ